MRFLAIFWWTLHYFWLKFHIKIVLIIIYNFSIDTMAGKIIFTHFSAILGQFLAKLCDFQIALFWDRPIFTVRFQHLNEVFLALPPKCNPFPWKVSNFEILSLESGSSVSPNFDFFFSIFFNFQPIFKFKIEFKLFKWYIGSFFTHFVQKPCQFLDLTTVNMQKMPF